ncbi:MAG: secretin N-terminal domain-containing protein [Thermodesulfovibrionales bacterium]
MNYRAYSLTLISLILSLYIVPPSFAQVAGDEKVPQAEAETKAPATNLPEAGAPIPKEGQQAPVEPQQQPAMPEKPAQPQKASPTVSFFFDDADIFEVVQTIFADVLKVNYIIDPQVKGRVNFRTVTPIPKNEVLTVMEIIFRLNGIGFVEEGGLYRIIPLTDVPKELVYSQIGKSPDKVAIEMFTFKNLNIKESMPDIENALGLHLKGGTVRIMPIDRLNALIVIASSMEQLEYIKQWIVTFDSIFAAARPKIFVYPLQNSKAEHIASLMQSILSGGGGGAAAPSRTTAPAPVPPKTPTAPTASAQTTSQPSSQPRTGAVATVSGGGGFVSPETKIFADEITNSLIVLATPTDYKFIEDTIKRLDIMPRQVVIEGLIAKVTLDNNLSFGISWQLNTDFNITNMNPFTKNINLSGSATSTPTGTNLTNSSGDGFTFVATDPKGIVRAKLAAALSNNQGKVLAAPHILVVDNREARIQVGRQIPLATSATTYIPTSGTTENTPITSTVQYKDIGIILKVKPQINDSGLVSLELSQELSDVSTTTTDIAGQKYSAIDKTETTTTLVVQDGETIVIGGLIREDNTKTKTGIPFLSQIPLIGNLFSYTEKITARTELIILLTPHVIKNQKEAGDVTTDYIDRYKGTTKDKEIDEFIKEKSQRKQDDNNKDNTNK